jgi:3-deoxy-D-manno-octulosonate 8-phosphate phosphatase (KDO 8-P phosphatase)
MDIQQIFENQGGEFVSPPSFILDKLKNIKAYIFDWDGVFNTGTKTDLMGSGYSEVDSMGLNILRFGYWLFNQNQLPHIAIITGENNQTAIKLATRESLHAIYFGFKDKAIAFEHFLKTHQLMAEEVAFVFDDILDIPVARSCGLRFMANREGSPLFTKFLKTNNLVDYVSGQSGGGFAVREICELALGLLGQYEKAVTERASFSKEYTDYLEQREKTALQSYKFVNGQIEKV